MCVPAGKVPKATRSIGFVEASCLVSMTTSLQLSAKTLPVIAVTSAGLEKNLTYKVRGITGWPRLKCRAACASHYIHV